MITRVAQRLQPLISFKRAFCFSKFKDPKGKSPFFIKNKDKNKSNDQSKEVESGENPFKPTVRSTKLFKKPSLFEKQDHKQQNRGKLFSRSDSDSHQFVKATPVEQKPFSIFHQKIQSTPKQDKKPKMKNIQMFKHFYDSQEPRIKRKEEKGQQIIYFPNYQETIKKLAGQSMQLIQYLNKQSWQEVNATVNKYQKLTSAKEAVIPVHSLLLNQCSLKYVKWLKISQIDIKQFPHYFLRNLLNILVTKGHLKEVRWVSNVLMKNTCNMEFNFLDSIFSDMEAQTHQNISLSSLQDQIQTALAVLKICENNSYNDKIYFNKYQPGPWLSQLWSLTKYNQTLLSDFIPLFQTLYINHHEHIYLMGTHSNGLFFDVLETYYFGSHITTSKLKLIFAHIFRLNCYYLSLDELRDRMRLYSITTGLNPFPNAHNLYTEMDSAMKSQKYQQSLLYYLLAEYCDEKKPYHIFQDNRQLLNIMKIQQSWTPIVNEGLLNSPKKLLASVPKQNDQGSVNEHKVKQKIKKFTQSKAQSNRQGQHGNEKIQESDPDLKKEDQYLSDYVSVLKGQEKIKNQDQVEEYQEQLQSESEYPYLQDRSQGKFKPPTPSDPFVKNMQFLHRSHLRLQAQNQTNPLRKQLFKILINNQNIIQSVKAAIKLDRLQEAFTLFKQTVMRTKIRQRMQKNIEYVVKRFMIEHHKTNKELNIHEAIDGLTMKMIKQLDAEGGNSNFFLESIYQKMENFDYLLWNAMPDGEMKYDFWDSTLILERAKQIIKKDIKGQLQDIAYEPEIEQIPQNKVKQFRKDIDWRSELIYGLGYQEPDATPTNRTTETWKQMESLDEFNETVLQPTLEGIYKKAKQVRYFGGQTAELPLVYEQQEIEEYQQGQIVEEVAEGEELEGQKVQEIQQNAINTGEEVENIEATGEEVEVEQIEQTSEQVDQSSEVLVNIFEHSQKNNIKGYDFNLFLHQSNKFFKPYFQNEYASEKQFKRHMLALQAIAEQARIGDNYSLQKKLNESQETVSNPATIARLLDHKLWNYDFVTVKDPIQFPAIADKFRKAFFEFKKYMGFKTPYAVPNLSKKFIFNFQQAVIYRQITTELVEELLMNKHELFLQAQAVVKIEPIKEIEELMTWGMHNDQPLAVYLGQKLAMLTNQTISHNVALAVGQYFSHKRQIPEQRMAKCKQALKIVGRINRQHIYDFNKDYEHISIRKHFKNHLKKCQNDGKLESLEYLTNFDPTHQRQTTSNIKSNLSRGGLAI